MTAAFYNTAQPARYGAAELKRLAGNHAMYGLFLSVGIVGAVFLVAFFLSSFRSASVVPPRGPHITWEWNDGPPKAPSPNNLSDGGAGGAGSDAAVVPTGVQHPAGISAPVDMPDALPLDGGVGDSSFDLPLGNGAGNNGGDVSDAWGLGSGGSAHGGGTAEISEDDEQAFEPVPDVLPVIDEAGLRSLVVYPPMAKRMRLDGKVVVMVIIGVQGSPVAASIASSTNDIFNQAALDAVTKATFKPAYRNGNPVQYRLYVPIEFKMK